MSDDDADPLLRLGQLIFEANIPEGVIATAIEQHGVYSWDRYGRFKHFGPESDKAARALDHLARCYDARTDFDNEGWFDWEVFSDAGGDSYCWPSSHAPDFDAIRTGQIQPSQMSRRQAPSEIKSENAHAGIILGLLRFIKGELPGIRPHPNYQSETRLREFLDSVMVGYPGCSARNTLKKFSIANALMRKSNSRIDG